MSSLGSARASTSRQLLIALFFIVAALLCGNARATTPASSTPAPSHRTCAPGCTLHGTCNEELGRCDCPRHRGGANCSRLLPEASACKQWGFAGPLAELCTGRGQERCLNSCNGRGECVGGWCHCQPGYWGADCIISWGPDGRAVLLDGQDYRPAKHGPSVYIYEVPPRYNTWKSIEKNDRPLYAHLWKRLVSAGHRTLDGASADYFYLPVDFRYLFGEATPLLQHVRETWPHWNATGGARHLLLSTSDLGGCEGAQLMRIRNATSRCVWITPWGLTRKHPKVWWPGCHRPGLDIVFPIPAQTPGMLRTPLNPRSGPAPARNTTFYFAGKICGDNKPPRPDGQWPVCSATNPLYSAGMRQQVYHHHSRRPGYHIVHRSASYITDMATSKFCLAPTGGGHGKRQVLVARFGCIPVPITDFVMQPFEPELDWASFSVPVAEAEVPRMHQMLAEVTDERLAAMQAAVVCASQHMWWSTLWGGLFGEDGRYDAFATLMEILAVRLRHPGAAPEDYRRLDERFLKFAECRLDEDVPLAPPLCTYHSHGLEGDSPLLAPTPFCQSSRYGKYGIPGGAICQNAKSIASCPRPGEG